MAEIQPLGFDIGSGQLTCRECDSWVDGVLVPLVGKPRPMQPGDKELQVDVEVDVRCAVLQPCGHLYITATGAVPVEGEEVSTDV